MKMRKLLFTSFFSLLFALCNLASAQSKDYLIDGFDFSQLGQEDAGLLDSALNIYASASHDTIRLKAISILADNLYNGELWPIYNQLLYNKAIEVEQNAENPTVRNKAISYQTTAINNFGYLEFNKGNIEKSLEFYELSNNKQKEIGYLIGYSHSLNNLGALYFSLGKLDSALNKYNECIPIQKQLKDYEGLVQTLNNVAVVYREIGQTDLSAKFHLDALGYCQLTHDDTELAETYAYLGELYLRNQNLLLSKKYFTKGLEIQTKNDYTEGEAFAYSNLGKLYLAFDSLEKAEFYFNLSETLFSKINHQVGRAGILMNLGKIEKLKGDFYGALSCYQKGLFIRKEMQDVMGEASSLSHIAYLYYDLNRYDSAKYFCELSLQKAISVKDYHIIEKNSFILYKMAKKEGKIGLALTHFEQYIAARDTLSAEENKESLIDLQYREQYITKTFEDSLNYLKKELHTQEKITTQQTELNRQNDQILYLSCIGLILAGVVVLVLYGYRKKTEANQIIQLQKTALEKKNAEINESLNYARKIQEALLKDTQELNDYFEDYRLFFQPRDVVSGDFYWWHKKDRFLYLAVGDCTGHGVPGALMSALSLSFLEEIVATNQNLSPSILLELLRNKIMDELSQNSQPESVKDGLDMALLRIDLKTQALDWSGAHNSFYLFSQREISLERPKTGHTFQHADYLTAMELATTDQHVGFNHRKWPFEDYRIQLQKGDVLTIFTDGFPDQFGGLDGGKLKYATFKDLAGKMISETPDFMSNAFLKWKGNYEQVDDVCVLTFKI